MNAKNTYGICIVRACVIPILAQTHSPMAGGWRLGCTEAILDQTLWPLVHPPGLRRFQLAELPRMELARIAENVTSRTASKAFTGMYKQAPRFVKENLDQECNMLVSLYHPLGNCVIEYGSVENCAVPLI